MGRKCGQKGPQWLAGNSSWPGEGSVWSKPGVEGEGQGLEGGVDVRAGPFQGRGLGVGERKWLGPDGQMIGGGPGGRRCRKDFDSTWTDLSDSY